MNKLLEPAELRRAAISMLARRDYSRQGLCEKLLYKFGKESEVDVEPVLDWLEEKNFLNDARFADVFVRASIERGRGLLRIRQDLQQRSISASCIEQVLDTLEIDWFMQACRVRQRRFGGCPEVSEQKEKARQLRYLQYRGFSAPECFYALTHSPELSDSPTNLPS